MAETLAPGVPPAARSPLRQRGGWALLAVVVAAHLLGANELLADRFGWGDGLGGRSIARIEVAFVRELAPREPPPVEARPTAPAAARAALPSVASAPARRASAPVEAGRPAPLPVAPPEPPPEARAETVPEVPPAAVVEPPPPPPMALPREAAPDLAAASSPATTTATAPALPASAPPPMPVVPAAPVRAFDWPPSTRMSYQLRGYFRGPVQGRAQVEWLRSGTRYQVHLDASVAPIFSRRITSEGELTERGLVPHRFEGEQKVLLRSPRRWTQQFGPERIVLADGKEVDTLPGAQDEASQFVQLTWLFTTQPGLLQVGRSIEVPLALNRRFDRWVYDIKEIQQLELPFGTVETYYVKPRRVAQDGNMAAEIWFAPSLQYLPVRIVIRQDETNHIDLLLDKPPLQAGER